MFLAKKRKAIGDRVHSMISATERGSALIGVLGIMSIAGIVGVTSTSVSVHAVGFTTSTRAGVQAEAAAEAGIDFAAASLATSICQSQYASSTAPVFSVVVAYSTLQTSPGDVDTSWVIGCPSISVPVRLKLTSTGSASSPGVAGNSSNDFRKVEAIYGYTPAPPAFAIVPSGPALYSFAQVDPTINNLTLTQAGTVRPSIQILSGSVTCTSGTTITGDVILGAGSLSVTSGCTINGDLWASGGIDIQSGEVTGNVDSEDEQGQHGHSSVSISPSSKVDGDVYSSGEVTIHGKVGGDVVAGPNAVSSTFGNSASVGGSVITSGTVTAAAGVVKGTITANLSGIVIPPVPISPPWVDYAFNAGDWKTANGTPYATLTLTSCSSNTLASAINTVQNSLVPIILDTRICGAVTDFRGLNMSLHSDTVIVANGFNMSSNNIQSSSSSDERLWIIIPDAVLDHVPSCTINSSAKIGNNVNVGAHIAAMIYSPCAISNSGDVWRGQMYSSSIGTSSSFTLNFLPIGLPTVNLSTGQFLPPPGTGVLGNRQTIRDLSMG